MTEFANLLFGNLSKDDLQTLHRILHDVGMKLSEQAKDRTHAAALPDEDGGVKGAA
ncbi:MAG TPA: hypothetical protein VKB16_24105 [Beijerinckiaceae bacterium]|nr:hypothetical protein [Beijerinckiaceae bacterium]